MIEETKAATRKLHSAASQFIYERMQSGSALEKLGVGRKALGVEDWDTWMAWGWPAEPPPNTEKSSAFSPPAPAHQW